MRISLSLLACSSIVVVASHAVAQSPSTPQEAGAPAAVAAANPAGASDLFLQPTLQVVLDAQPSAPAAFDETSAYLPLKGGRLLAIDLGSGQVRWTSELTTTWAPSVSVGIVVVAADELLTAFDSATGRAKWRVPVAGGFSAPPIVDNGWVIALSASGDVLAVRADDGGTLWTRSVGAPANARAVVAASGVYVPLQDGRIIALALNDGVPRWEVKLGGKPGELLVLDDRLFVGADDKFFYALKTSDGDVRWKQRVGGRPAGSAAVDTKRVYYVALDNILWAFHRGNGGRQWHTPLPVRPSGGPLVVGDVVVVAGVAAEVYAYRVKSGELAGKSESPADLASPPQMVPSKVPALTGIAMVTRTGIFTVLARRLEPPPTPLPYPLGTELPLSLLGTD